MLIIRKYRKLDWFDFVDMKTRLLKKSPGKEIYIELIDELRMRKLESMSEGATYKMGVLGRDILNLFIIRASENSSFASSEDIDNLRNLVEEI